MLRPSIRSAVRALLAAAFVLSIPMAAHAQSGAAASPIDALHWRSVGPFIGGRVVAVTGVRGTPNLFYMGAVDGGVWKSTDYGIRWTNISDGTMPDSSGSIGALAVSPSNPSIIYAGTGEADIRGDMITGDGVFRSSDAGKTWAAAGLRDTHTIMGLVVDPANPDVVYAATMGHVFAPGPHRGVFKSTDGGKHWTRILFVNDSTGAVDLVMDPRHPSVLYAATWQAFRTPYRLTSGGAGSALYKTTDGGTHWTKLSTNPGFPSGVLGKIGVAVAGNAPNVVYATVQAKQGGVFRSSDGGATWTRMNHEWKLRQRAFYYMAIFVDPTDSNTVYMPEVDALFVSHDGAKTFTPLHTPHGDNHIVWINPDDPKILLEGNDGGATVSTDGGKTWSTEHNQPTGQFYHVNLDDQFPFHMYGAQQDEGSYEGPSATPAHDIPIGDWHRVAYGESTPSVPQPGDPDITYGSGYFSIFLRYDLRTGQYQSASPWPHYQEGASSGELKYRFAWTHPILFSPATPHVLFIGSQYVMTSADHGATWHVISPDLTRNDTSTTAPTGGPIDLDQSGAEIYATISALAVSPLSGEVMWAGSDDGLVHVTTDGGLHWRPVTPPSLPTWTYISCIEPSHVSRGTAYLTASRYMWDDFHPYVFKTTDYGKHWTAITDGLPNDAYVMALRQDPVDAELLLAGTRNAPYASFDGGAHWRPLSLGLPPVQVRDVAFDTRQGDVVIATHGRAFWVLDNLTMLEQMTRRAAPPADSAALFAPQRAWLSHAYGLSNRRGGADAGKNPPFGATVFFQVPSDYDGQTPVALTFTDADGHTVRRFELHRKEARPSRAAVAESQLTPTQRKAAAERRHTAIVAGMNVFQWDLRYPEATEVKGFEPPVAAGGLPDETDGPVVAPGRYQVVLDYGGHTMKQSFDVTLDPRLHATQPDLEARLALQMRIHRTLDGLDRALNVAIAVRDSLAAQGSSAARHRAAALDSTIGSLVQLDLHSSEGSLLHETKLRSHLAYLAADIDLAYVRPTAAQYAVYRELAREASAGEQRLRAESATEHP